MNFHEYQSKQLLAEYGIPVPAGKVAATPDEAVAAAQSLGQGPWMVKAQIHAGGRGKAGGVKFCKTTDDVKAAAAKMLGTKMATYQTAGVELPVDSVPVSYTHLDVYKRQGVIHVPRCPLVRSFGSRATLHVLEL